MNLVQNYLGVREAALYDLWMCALDAGAVTLEKLYYHSSRAGHNLMDNAEKIIQHLLTEREVWIKIEL